MLAAKGGSPRDQSDGHAHLEDLSDGIGGGGSDLLVVRHQSAIEVDGKEEVLQRIFPGAIVGVEYAGCLGRYLHRLCEIYSDSILSTR